MIGYRRPAEVESTDRVVHPLGLVTKRGVWYLVANTDRGLRTYRVDRIARIDELDEPVDRPADFDLDEHWAAIVTHVEQMRTGVEADVRVSPTVARPMRWVFSGRFEEQGVDDDGWTLARVGDSRAESLAAQLAGFGAQVELVDPPAEIAAEMCRIAADLAAVWLR